MHYYIFENIIPDNICDIIIKHCDNLENQNATLDSDLLDYGVRDTEVSWVHDTWIISLLTHHINGANILCGWDFDIDNQNYPCQYGVYKTGKFFDWHQDNSKNRKLTGILQLTDPSEYEGGQLLLSNNVFLEGKIHHDSFKLSKGSIIVFPSHIVHRVNPVMWGTRRTLVQWAHGPKIK